MEDIADYNTEEQAGSKELVQGKVVSVETKTLKMFHKMLQN